jgi:hypothetical protein
MAFSQPNMACFPTSDCGLVHCKGIKKDLWSARAFGVAGHIRIMTLYNVLLAIDA